MGSFRFDRLEKIYDSRSEAIKKLNSITFDYAQPVVVRYKEDSNIYMLLVIGSDDSNGYKILADSNSSGDISDIYTVTRTSFDVSDEDSINLGLFGKTPHQSDIVIISTIISEIVYDRVAYIYTSKNIWEPLSGCVDADKIIFKDDIQLFGSYSEVGNIKKSDKVWKTKGKSVWQAFNELLDTTVEPTVLLDPSVSIVATTTGSKEIGTTVQQGYRINLTDGKYECAGIEEPIESEITSCNISYSGDFYDSFPEGTVGNIVLPEGYSQRFTGSVTIGTSNYAENNKGVTTELLWSNGSKEYQVSSGVLSSYRMGMFYGTVVEKIEDWSSSGVLNTKLRGLNKSGGSYSASTKTFTLKAGSAQMIIAWPKSDGRKGLTQVLDTTNNENISLSNFQSHEVIISGADGNIDSSYSASYIVMEYAPISGNWLKDIVIQLKFE